MTRMYKPSLAIVDDEPNFSESLQMALEDTFEISVFSTLREAREALKAGRPAAGPVPDVVLLDIRLPDGEGTELLKDLKSLEPMPVVIVMTAYATVENAINALKLGAVDYFTKPLDIEKLKRELNVYLENKSLHKKIIAMDREIKRIVPPFTTTGDGKMKDIVDKVPMIAPLDIPVLVRGETGTGKEKLAKWIHELSGLNGELVAINCASLPKDILESELFGYTKGAFSGAASYKGGLIERADGGTLFLDEIGELSEDVQAKFLRVLEGGVYYKLGDAKERKTRFRLISATSKDITDPQGRFRQDLYYRINGISFELPPLRERKSDIALLVSAFINEANYSYNKEVQGVSPKVLDSLLNYSWPGNIRELKWCINRGVAIVLGRVLNSNEITLGKGAPDCQPGETAQDFTVPLEKAVERIEKRYIENAIASTGANKTEAAKILGISVRALHYKINKYGL